MCRDPVADPALERLAGLAAKALDAPMAMVSLVDGSQGRAGAPALEAFCGHVVRGGTLVVDDAREHEQTKGLAVVRSGKALAYVGVPLGGAVTGTLCVADAHPRAWKREQVALLEELAQSVRTEIELRAELETRRQAEAELQRLRGLLDAAPAAIYAQDLEGRTLFANPAAGRLLERGDAKALLRRLETAVDAAHSALSSALPAK